MKISKRIFQNELVQQIVSKIIAALMRFCYATTRWKLIGLDIPDEYIKSNKGLLMALWHDRLMTAPCAWKWKKTLHVLASAHRDGRIIAKTVENLGMKPVYGSTGKCSTSSLKEMINLCNSNECLAIIPDGPRGPRHTVSKGIIEIAKITKTDIIPFSCCVKKFKRLNSWDKFIIAYPFNKGVIICGKPLEYSDIAEKSLEECEKLLEAEIRRISELAKTEMDKL